jgi:hypothetical protein
MRTPIAAALLLLVLTGTPAPAADAAQEKVVYSGSVRSRVEAWDWFAAHGGDGSYVYVGTLLRLSAAGRARRNDWQIELAAPWLANLPTDAQAPPPEGPLGLGANYRAASGGKEGNAFLKQGFVRIHGLGSPANALRSIMPPRRTHSGVAMAPVKCGSSGCSMSIIEIR